MWLAFVLLMVIVLAGCVLIIGTHNSVKTHDEPELSLIHVDKEKEIDKEIDIDIGKKDDDKR